MRNLKLLLLLMLPWLASAAMADDSVPAPERKPVPDGKYIYIPDSLQKDVLRLLDGHSKVVDD